MTQNIINQKYRIAISGKKGSGKSTFARMLHRSFKKIEDEDGNKARKSNVTGSNYSADYDRYRVEHYAFANQLKHIAMMFDPNLDKKVMFGPSDNRKQDMSIGFTKIQARDFLIKLSDFILPFDKNIWTKITLDKIIKEEDYCLKHWQNYSYTFNKKNWNIISIISDLRLQSEYNVLKNENFFIIRLIGKNQDNDKSIWETDLDHLTQKNFHFWIENTGSKKDLKHQVDQIARQIIQQKTPHILP